MSEIAPIFIGRSSTYLAEVAVPNTKTVAEIWILPDSVVEALQATHNAVPQCGIHPESRQFSSE